jgi:DNA/RNA endonuclease G (NUC1)
VVVTEKLTYDDLNHVLPSKRPRFLADAPNTPRLPPDHLPSNATYKHSGYSKGHLVPASSHPLDYNGTFTLLNTVLQSQSLNAGLWSDLEMWTRWLTMWFDTVYVVTGPVYAPGWSNGSNKSQLSSKSNRSGDSGPEYVYASAPPGAGQAAVPDLIPVPVPTALFKCVACVDESGGVFVECFIIPNAAPGSRKTQVSPADYKTTVSFLERLAGLEILPELLKETNGPGGKAPIVRRLGEVYEELEFGKGGKRRKNFRRFLND